MRTKKKKKITKEKEPRQGGNLKPRRDDHIRFICPECDEISYTHTGWRRHLNTTHNYNKKSLKDLGFRKLDSKRFECLVCSKHITDAHQTLALLQYHTFLHLRHPRVFGCRYCPDTFVRKRLVGDHVQLHHGNLMASPDKQKCLNLFKEAVDSNDPTKNDEFYLNFLCPMCGRKYEHFRHWEQHINSAHTATSVELRIHRIVSASKDSCYFCNMCKMILLNNPTKTQQQRHHFTHLPFPYYFQCAFCTKRRTYKTEILMHFIQGHPLAYAATKKYLKIPKEWGADADKKIVATLTKLLRNDAEENVDKTTSNECGGNQSIGDLESVVKENIIRKVDIKLEFTIEDDDLEAIYSQMFEEIDEFDQPIKHNGCFNRSSGNSKNAVNEFKKVEQLTPAQLQAYINYLCPECGIEFPHKTVWREHAFTVHNLAKVIEINFRPLDKQKSAYLCLMCLEVQWTTKHAELKRHHFQHMPYQSYLKCSLCPERKSSKSKIMQHLQAAHPDTILNCIATQSNSNDKIYKCTDCLKIYKNQTLLNTHREHCPTRKVNTAPSLGTTYRLYNIEENMKILEHLNRRSEHISRMLMEQNIDPDSIVFKRKL